MVTKSSSNIKTPNTSIYDEIKTSCENYLIDNCNNLCGMICQTALDVSKCITECRKSPILGLSQFNIVGILGKSLGNREVLAINLKRAFYVKICVDIKVAIFDEIVKTRDKNEKLNDNKIKEIAEKIGKMYMEKNMAIKKIVATVDNLIDKAVSNGYYQVLAFLLGILPVVGDIILGIIKTQNIKKRAAAIMKTLNDVSSNIRTGGTRRRRLKRMRRTRTKRRIKRGIQTKRGIRTKRKI